MIDRVTGGPVGEIQNDPTLFGMLDCKTAVSKIF